MNQNYIFRKIRASEAVQFFDLRVLGLRTDPQVFVATLDEELQLSLADVENYLKKNFVMGVFVEGNAGSCKLVGTLVYMEQEREKFKHIGILGGMYVHPEHRGFGLARKLLATTLQNLQKFDHLVALQLKVVTTNIAAIRLYESCGFLVWATEKNALQSDGNFYDQHYMMKTVDSVLAA